MDATVGLTKRRKLSERIFGYDVFISFALGEPPRGSFSYASDLARRLQDAGLVVFFCEEELGYGDTLSTSLDSALANSKVMAVIINAEVLEDPRWIRIEVEQFRRYHPKSPVIPVSLDRCLPDIAAQKVAVENWHGFEKRKFILELHENGASNSASQQTLDSIITSVGRLRANFKWRALVAFFVFLLLVLTLVSWRMKFAADLARNEAEHKQHVANMFVVAAEQSNGEFLEAMDTTKRNHAFPTYFVDNIRQALFQRAVLLDTKGESSILSMKLVTHGATSSLVLGSRYETIRILPLNNKLDVHECDSHRYLSNVVVSADGSFWIGYEIGEQDDFSVLIRRWPDCKPLKSDISRWQDMLRKGRANVPLQAAVPLPDNRLLVGWLDGKLEIYTANAQSLSIPIKPFPLAAVWADREGRRIAVLDKGHQLRLFNLGGESLAPPLKLKLGAAVRITSKPWEGFFGNLNGGKTILLQPAISLPAVDDSVDLNDPALIVAPESVGVLLMLQRFTSESDMLFDQIVFRDNVTGCVYAQYLTDKKFGILTLQDQCVGEYSERKIEIEYPRSAARYSAGAICQDGQIVVGDWDGNIYWMRRVENVFDDVGVELEHVERSWSDAVSGVVCGVSGAVYVSYRSHGVKLFVSSWQLQEREINRVSVDTDSSYWPEEDIAWNVDTFHGAGVLYLRASQGDLELVSGTQLVWRRNFARPRAYETGSSTDAIHSVAVDAARKRLWVLTSLGRLSLVELNTGSVLARFGTNFFSAAAVMPTGFDKLTISEQGGVSFSYEWDGKFFEVTAKPRGE